jgi:predicted anti-sigma-YlaC factor YlaD
MRHGRIELGMDVVLRPWVATCDETRERLSAHFEGTLRGREAKRVLRHLARCPNCREALRSLARTVEALRSLARSESPDQPSVADAVVDHIRREEPPRG